MNDGDLEAIRREHRQRLFDRYQNEAGAFSRLFTGLLIFSAFFLAFALVPYAVLQHNRQVLARSIIGADRELEKRKQEAAELETQLKDMQAQAKQRNQLVAALAERVKATEQKASAAAARVTRNQTQAAKNSADQKQTGDALEALRQSQAVIGATRTDPETTVREVRTYLSELTRDAGSLRPDAACPEPDSWRLIGCRLGQRVSARITERFQPLEQNVIPAIARIDESAGADLRQKLATVRTRLQRRPLDQPNFWRTSAEKEHFSQELEQEFRVVVQELRQVADRAVVRLRNRSEELEQDLSRLRDGNAAFQKDVDAARADQEKLSRERNQLEDDIAKTRAAQDKAEVNRPQLKEQMAQLTKDKAQLTEAQNLSRGQQEDIAKRLSSIQSPFGTLPIGLREGILSFPLVVAAAYLLSAGSLASAIRLRGTCHRLYREWDERGQVVTDGQVALFAPLWIDPALGARAQPMAIALLLLPVPIFLAAVALIVYISRISEAPPLRGTMGWGLYGLASLAALCAILLALRRIRNAWQTYPQISAAEPPRA
jgi:septal ring factor EnvC (AmiA/AmiB activator)